MPCSAAFSISAQAIRVFLSASEGIPESSQVRAMIFQPVFAARG
jgi:hypothetical protein